MKREHRLRYIIKEGILDIFYIWKDELKNVFRDEGVLIFFFLDLLPIRCSIPLFIITKWYMRQKWWLWISLTLI